MIREICKALGAAFLLALAIAFFAATAGAQGSRKDDVVFNAQGRPMAGAAVRICTSSATGQPCSPLALIYSDPALTQALANPLATDGLGNYTFYAAAGKYMIEISGPGITTKQLPNVILPSDPSTPTFTTVTTTSGISAFSLSLVGNLTVNGSASIAGTLSVGGVALPSASADNTWTAPQRFKGPIPYRDATAYGAVSSSLTFTGTISGGTHTLTVNATGDWQNGQSIAVIGAGPTASITAPTLTALSVSSIARSSNVVTATVSSTATLNLSGQYVRLTGVTDSSYNGVFWISGGTGTTATWNQNGANSSSSGGSITPGVAVFEGIPAGSTTYSYNIIAVDTSGGYSAKSATMTVTNGTSSLSDLNFNWLWWNAVSGADYYAIYRNGTFIGRAYSNGYKDDGIVWLNTPNIPNASPSSAGPQTLVTSVAAGTGTTTLTLSGLASTTATNAFTFHDSAPAINAALTDALADSVIGGMTAGAPEVVLPAGLYWVSRITWPSPSSTTLRQVGAIQLTTHPIIMDNTTAPSLVGQSNSFGTINYNGDGQANIKSDVNSGTYAVEPIVIKGPGGGKTVKNVHLDSLTVRGIVLAASPQAGANGFTIDNVSVSMNNSYYGECLWIDSDAIFGRITNLRCAASTVTTPARPSIHLSSVSLGGSWIDLAFERIFMRNGLFYVDSPTYSFTQSGSVSRIQHWKMNEIQSESTTVKGVFTVDSSCNELAGGTNAIGMLDTIVQRVDFADPVTPLKGFVYTPRVGMPGCTGSGISPIITSMGGLGMAVTGSDTVGMANTNRFVSFDPGDGSAPDANTNELEGGSYFRSGSVQENNPLYLGFTNQNSTTEPILAALLRIPTAAVVDNGAGGTCSAGTYYFRVAVGDGTGGFSKASQEVSITTAGGRILQVQYSVGSSPYNKFGTTYRIYVGTTSGGENTYYTGTFNTFNYTCASGTAGTPQEFTNAYSYKLPSLSGQAGWFGGTDPAFKFGFGKTNPAFMLDVAGTVHADTGFNGPGFTNLRTCSIVVGADNASVALVTGDLGPQGGQCLIPVAATVIEITVKADAGTPNVIVQKEHGATPTALLSTALATASAGGVACSRPTAVACLDGVTTASATLQNTSLSAGDWIGLASGTPGGTAKRMSISLTYSVN
jgi:hypothetical protein